MNTSFLDFCNLNPEYKKIIQGVEQEKSCSIFGVSESLKVMLTSELNRSILYIASDVIGAKKIQEYYEQIYPKQTILFPAVPDNMLFKNYVPAEPYIERNSVLLSALTQNKKIIITSVDALLFPLPSVENFKKNIIELFVGENCLRDTLSKKLSDSGYLRVELVSSPGEYSVRGDIIDIYEISSLTPYRVDFFDDEIESISEFDPQTNKKGKNINKIVICPNTILFGDNNDAIKILEKLKTKNFESADEESEFKNVLSQLLTKLEINDKSYNLECVLPLVEKNTATLFDYINNETILCFDESKMVYDSLIAHTKEREERIKDFSHGSILLSTDCFIKKDVILERIKRFTKIAFQKITSSNRFFDPDFVVNLKSNPTLRFVHSHTEFAKTIKSLLFHGHKVYIFTENLDNAKSLKTMFENHDVFIDIKENAKITDHESAIIPQLYAQGFNLPQEKIVVFGTYDIYAKKVQEKKYSASRNNVFSVPKVGDYVVHSFHGIGICEGVTKLDGKFGTKDFIVVRYRDNDKLFVPIDQLNQLEKFSGGETPSRLSKIGGVEFAKVKAKVKEGVKKIAFNLIHLYAERDKLRGHAFPEDDMLQLEFENSFPYSETEDQLISLGEIKKDMQSGRVMDRLLCGDVGYGKTEVALRAAFKAVLGGKQVAFIAPTTILSEQHYNTALSRLKDFGVNIEVLNRFKTPKQVKFILSELALGKIDIIFGTHRLLSKDVEFNDLGLIILDEEQKFGVEDKEKLKVNHKNVDVLTLSATPIPRTLHMSLSGIRDVSIISTPPSIRLPIETYVTEQSDNLIYDAVTREMRRGGQTFILFNNVEKIYSFAARIKDIVKDAKILVAHGQMSGKELENIIYKFYSGDADVLVCTTIIENGIDIENANTLIVIDSDRFGLSQLYQIRGRVGRGNRLGYAYFTYNNDKVLTEEAYKRLEAISEFTEFGSGFKLAMKDLEIRGGGNIFGAEQHGHMQKVGYDMYSKLLAEAVNELRGISNLPKTETTVRLAIDAFIPDSYIISSEDRMTAYKNIAAIDSLDSYNSTQKSMESSFGTIPTETLNLLKISYARALASKCRIKEILSSEHEIRIIFEEDEKIVGNEKIGEAIYAFRSRCVLNLSNGNIIKFNKLSSARENLEEIIEFLSLLSKLYDKN